MDAETRPVVLTERQRRVLWLLSMGTPREEIVRRLTDTKGGVDNACDRIFRLLRADTAAHAVRNGLLSGHIGPYEDCGTRSAYRRHIQRDEPICQACKRGNLERLETEAAMRSRPLRLSEPQIRLLRAFDAGRTWDQIASAWNISQQTVKHLTTATYRALGVSELPQSVRREEALRKARERGLLGATPPVTRTPVKRVRLTDTQAKILAEMATGASLTQISERLGLARGTCSTRVSEIYRRLDVTWMDKDSRRTEAIRRARRMGLLPEPVTT